GAGRFLDSGTNFALLLRALRGDSNSNILQTPSIITMDNEEAEIKVAQEVPFLTGSFTNTGVANQQGQVNPFQTIQREEVGTILKITPQINEGDSVHLKIDAEVSNLTGSSVGGQPVTNKRQIKTSVLAKDREIVVLGGLIDHDLIESEQRVPVLGSIPLLGNLFRYRKTTNTKRNLMVFIQPTILRDSESTRQYTNEQYKYLRELQMRNQGPVKLMPGEKRPMLDELQKSVTKPAAPTAGTTTVPAKAAPPTAATTAAPAAAQSVQHDPGH
ncbi:MAG TPA: type II secretion system protein GspD, partial [Gammaproteobacteria bacterium]|nr:type II secretion system protein GspD [Gammaproteobacteria bacterium]